MSADSGKGTHPSQDPVNPDWNRWLGRDGSGRLQEITPEEQQGGTRKTKPRAQAAHLQALAVRIGADPEALAERIPADTLRRLKYPMLEHVEEDGKRSYKHDVGIIVDGRRSLLATDHSNEPIEQAPTKPRNERGQFSK